MRAYEFLIEYSRKEFITNKTLVDKMISAFLKDNSSNLPNNLIQIKQQMKSNEANPSMVVKVILKYLDTLDPTKNKIYTHWLAKTYSNGNTKLDEINPEILTLYHQAKEKNKLKPEHKDIYNFNSFNELKSVIQKEYDNFAETPEEMANKSIADKVYEDSDWLVVVPENEAAAIKYGKGTMWCTAAKYNNAFNDYNNKGKLYYIIPKKPAHDGEKYAIWFTAGSYLNEQDKPSGKKMYDRFSNELNDFLTDIDNKWAWQSGELEHIGKIIGIDVGIDSSGAVPNLIQNKQNPYITWKLNNEVHRIDGPAEIYADGDQYYYEHDKLQQLVHK